jgi:hypothetical protein
MLAHEWLVGQRFFEACENYGIHVERQAESPQVIDLSGRTGQHSQSQAGESIGFRKRARDEQVRMARQVGDQALTAKLEVGFVDKDRCIRRSFGNLQ